MRSDTGRVKRWPPGWLVPLTGMLGLVLGLCSAAFAAEEGKQYLGKVVYEKTILGKEYRIETIEDEAGSYRVYWGEEELKWEPKPWHEPELIEKGPVIYTEWLEPMYFPYTIPLEKREKFDAFDCMSTGGQFSQFSVIDYEDTFDAHLYSPTGYRRDKTGFEWLKWYLDDAYEKLGPEEHPNPFRHPDKLREHPFRRYILLFRSPRDLLKVGFLQIQYIGDKDDENFLYLPTVRKVRRLATGNRQDVIGGLIVRQEQIGLSKPIHNYKMIKTELYRPPDDMFTFGAEGEPSQPDPEVKRLDGVGEPCWVFETTPFREDWWFAKQITWQGIFTLIQWQIDSYDKEGRLIQRLTWPQKLEDRGEVPNPVGRKSHLVWAVTPAKDYRTGFVVYAYGPGRLLNPPLPDDFFNTNTLLMEPKTIDFYR